MEESQKDRWQDRNDAPFRGVSASADPAAVPRRGDREYFTVDLRGLRSVLAARAKACGQTESDVLREALAAGLADGPPRVQPRLPDADPARLFCATVKVSTRMPGRVASRLEAQARATGLSRSAYLIRLIEGMPAVVACADRAAASAALSASGDQLALLSRELTRLNQMLSIRASASLQPYIASLVRLDQDVRQHLDLAAASMADSQPRRARVARKTPRPARRNCP